MHCASLTMAGVFKPVFCGGGGGERLQKNGTASAWPVTVTSYSGINPGFFAGVL